MNFWLCLEKILKQIFGRAAWKSYSVKWVLCNNSAFDLELKKTTKKIDLIGRFRNLSDVHNILEKGPTFKFKKSNYSPNTCTFKSFRNDQQDATV
jgi:hypothetical protein